MWHKRTDENTTSLKSPQLRLKGGERRSEAQYRGCEEESSHGGHGDHKRPDDIEAGASLENRLSEGDEVGGGGSLHDRLKSLGRALHRRHAAGKRVNHHEHGHDKQAELQHEAGESGEQDAERGR